MKWIILLFILAFMPSLLYILLIRRIKRRFNTRLQRIRHRSLYHPSVVAQFSAHELARRPPYKDYIGDKTCRYNAHSPYLRCAINPSGPCKDCIHYEPEKLDFDKK